MYARSTPFQSSGFILFGALLIMIAGANVVEAYTTMVRGAFGGSRQITETVLKAGPLLLVGLGLTVAFRARVGNIGGEGQYYMGALFGAVIALTFPTWPRPLLLVALVIFARWRPGLALAGALLFGLADALQFRIQALSQIERGAATIPYEFLLMLPYLLTLLALLYRRGRTDAPAALGRPYTKETH